MYKKILFFSLIIVSNTKLHSAINNQENINILSNKAQYIEYHHRERHRDDNYYRDRHFGNRDEYYRNRRFKNHDEYYGNRCYRTECYNRGIFGEECYLRKCHDHRQYFRNKWFFSIN